MKVSELIEILQKYPRDARIVIEDADTGWLLNINRDTFQWKHVISISGSYSDLYEKR